MAMFKVHFENNRAVCGEQVPTVTDDTLTQLALEQSRTVLKWCVVDADHEEDAINRASVLARQRWSNLLKGKL